MQHLAQQHPVPQSLGQVEHARGGPHDPVVHGQDLAVYQPPAALPPLLHLCSGETRLLQSADDPGGPGAASRPRQSRVSTARAKRSWRGSPSAPDVFFYFLFIFFTGAISKLRAVLVSCPSSSENVHFGEFPSLHGSQKVCLGISKDFNKGGVKANSWMQRSVKHGSTVRWSQNQRRVNTQSAGFQNKAPHFPYCVCDLTFRHCKTPTSRIYGAK